MSELQSIINVISTSKEVAIISHFHPDGDALGSQIALALGLEKIGIKTMMLNKDPIPNFYKFLTNWESIKPIVNFTLLPNVLIFLDCASLERTGYNSSDFKNKEVLTINIDHHISNSNFADFNWVDSKAAATAELVYDLLSLLQIKINPEIATALYTGISTDSGSFLYENTTPTTHRVAADLITKGADITLIRTNYYENVSKGKLELLKFTLNNLSFTCNNRVVWVAIDEQNFQKSGASDADSEGLINYLKSITGIEVAIIFRMIDSSKIKVSFRSKEWFDVNQLAAIFGGGGHPRASGCILDGDLWENVQKVIDVIENSEGLKED